jgi:hypothetical protein
MSAQISCSPIINFSTHGRSLYIHPGDTHQTHICPDSQVEPLPNSGREATSAVTIKALRP